MKVDNEEVSTPPSKDNYTVEVKCDNADGEWNIEEWGADIRNIKSNRVKCNVNFISPKPTISEVIATSEKTSINLSYTTEGINVKTICKWGTNEGEYPNEVEGTNTECNINNLEMDTTYYYQVCAKTGGGESCKSGSIKTKGKTIADNVELGAYIRMTPTSTSYTIPASLTGYTSNQTINPSELNLWRVIKKNEDGTIDVVSECVSSTPVYFSGKTGYINFVKGLNTIAAQYTNDKYVSSTRHMGYSNQTETITNANKLDQTQAQWLEKTSLYDQWTGCDTNNYLCGEDEFLGAGDIGYETDYNLVNEVYGSMIAKTPTNVATPYWLASRHYYFYDEYNNRWNFNARLVNADGSLNGHTLYYYNNGFASYGPPFSVRPIITLKSDIQIISGDGKSVESAFQID